ncbi:MAG: hypothetical protein A2600_09835 [Candidatus Lambdaproteobacteria bacterium RIFOXYD1_FULL_56_27]|uniref:Uncharacterized protein n=1 Tax=Candidatus Lambdaproteobacteria bacterium RIFOXYD2_FULL_56_26 TaxID=1817773 RepID=A0A1F6GMD9_9PROT|nr:MAG: hypothetical protein A2557_02010 [Candidatus Lambdaproteobacteria bacterium RIFOXYD2_FULL_56_26]OGH03304.1 MAG: hypothetical protein A2426_07120 [Candidatus Lambdaproteobacteria bacterium RIFOXYC1_FULL_56_13]OGH09611.1 MAG: hypothetical protein A2600_09835 [Candidatus Lambdaproteobacteria bacterium RIFOXYD1_FULL_56_27]
MDLSCPSGKRHTALKGLLVPGSVMADPRKSLEDKVRGLTFQAAARMRSSRLAGEEWADFIFARFTQFAWDPKRDGGA